VHGIKVYKYNGNNLKVLRLLDKCFKIKKNIFMVSGCGNKESLLGTI